MQYALEETAGAVVAGSLIVASAMIDVSDPVIVTAVTAVLAALTGAIKILWDRNNKLSAATDAALSKCETEHHKAAERMDNLVQKVIELSAEVGTLKGRIQGYQEAKEQSQGK